MGKIIAEGTSRRHDINQKKSETVARNALKNAQSDSVMPRPTEPDAKNKRVTSVEVTRCLGGHPGQCAGRAS